MTARMCRHCGQPIVYTNQWWHDMGDGILLKDCQDRFPGRAEPEDEE